MKFRKMVTITLYARQQKRHRCIEQSFGLCGRRRGGSFLSLTLHMVWKVSTCGDLASFLTDSWLATGLRSRVTQSQHFATSVQWASRLHTRCWGRRFFQTRFLLSIGLLTTGRLVFLRSPFHSWHITGGQLWLLCLLCGGLFWYTLGVIFLFEKKFFLHF